MLVASTTLNKSKTKKKTARTREILFAWSLASPRNGTNG